MQTRQGQVKKTLLVPPTTKEFGLFLIFTLASLALRAQVTGSANIMATIVSPIGIDKSVDLDFGNVAGGSNPGTVVVTPSGTRSKTGGVTLPGAAGSVAAAAFIVTGVPNVTYSITLPYDPLPITCSGNSMTVGLFSSDPAGIGYLGPGGSQELHIGATLNVAALQPIGLYSSQAPFNVTVNYN